MRTKYEIFDDIEKISGKEKWSPEMIGCLTGSYLEVLIDIRDIIKEGFEDIDTAINNISLIR